MKSQRHQRFNFSNFLTSYKDAAGAGSQEIFWVNIDPVNMCALRTLPVSAFLSLQQTWELVNQGIIFSPQWAHCLPHGHCGKGTTVESGRHICSQRQARPPLGSSRALASVSRTSLITALVSLLNWRQRVLMGATRLQIWALTFQVRKVH